MILRIKKAIKILLNYKAKTIVSEDHLIQAARVKPWFAVNGDQTLRLDYDLNSNSVVFDVGGYKGEFAADIFCKYNANIYVFEPTKSFVSIIRNKFSKNQKVEPFHFGLSGKDQDLEITLSDNSSSIFLTEGQKEIIQLKSIVNFIKINEISKVDLIKINIEGGEYELLESLLENNCISIFKNIQVQFHEFLMDNAKERMQKIQDQLSITHELTYQYEFVWENWKLK